jgi:malonyl-CoA O-methyltransferase
MSQLMPIIEPCSTGFDAAADYYHKHAVVQRKSAKKLIHFLGEPESLPEGPILELGCGTGFLSRELMQVFPNREIILSDSSENMLKICRDYLPRLKNVQFKQWDARALSADAPVYSMTASNFVVQWIQNPGKILNHLLRITRSGGQLLAAFPGAHSFPEWKQAADELGLPCTANDLPDRENIVEALSGEDRQVSCRKEIITQQFERAGDFFRHLKETGAGYQNKSQHLEAGELKILMDYWDSRRKDGITVSWEVIYLKVKCLNHDL